MWANDVSGVLQRVLQKIILHAQKKPGDFSPGQSLLLLI
jgi:hypothetical protein